MVALDRTEQRIVGVLIEKQRTVPDTYPLSENALVDGCNQKSNRDPVTELLAFQVAGALLALQQKGLVARQDGGGRVPKFRHKLDEVLHLGEPAMAVMAELLLRGPQAPGALKLRVARMGYHASPEQVEVLLRELAAQRPPLVEQLPLGPREQQRRWRHRIGDGSELQEPAAVAATAERAAPVASAPPSSLAPDVPSPAALAGNPSELLARLVALEARVAALEAWRGARGGG